MILLLILVFIRYYIDRGRLLFCPCSGCQAASLTELGVGYAWENSPLRLVRHCVSDLAVTTLCEVLMLCMQGILHFNRYFCEVAVATC